MTFLPAFITLKAYLPNGTLFKDYSGDDELNLETTDQTPGGFWDCKFTLCNWKSRVPQFGYIIVVNDTRENTECFRGIAQNPEIDHGNSVLINAIGHGNSNGSSSALRDWGDGNQTPTNGKQIYTKTTPLSDILGDTFTLTQQIFEGDTVDLSGYQLTQESRDLQGMSPYDVWEYLRGMFAGFSTPWIWEVKSASGLGSFNSRFADSATRLRCTFDNETVKVKDSYAQDSVVNGATVRYGNGLRKFNPAVGTRSHTILPTNNDRDKYMDFDNEIRGDADAQALADVFLNRFNTLRPLNGSIELCGANVTALSPLVDIGTYPLGRSRFPVHLIPTGWVIDVQDLPAGAAPFNVGQHYIVAKRVSYKDMKVTLTTGELINLGTSIRTVDAYAINSGAIGTLQASYNRSEFRPAVTPIYGPQAAGDLPDTNDNQIGMASFKLNDTLTDTNDALLLKYKAAVDPELLADYGTQANFGREADSVGIKGFITVIPMKALTWYIAFLPPATGAVDVVPTDSIEIEFYTTYPFTPGSPFATKPISAAPSASGVFSGAIEQHVFAQGGRIGIRVSSAAATTGIGFVVAVGGRKLYPDLGINT